MIIEPISIASCRHYCGWRYGGFGNNLYEDYIVGLVNGIPLEILRKTFARRIFGTRRTNMDELLGIQLPRHYPPWIYPWSWQSVFARYKPYAAAVNPDIVCHTSPDGILASHINREFAWCEAALDSISRHGYQPEMHGYVTVLRLVGHEGEKSHLVLDGNHRLSALTALHESEIRAVIHGLVRLNCSRLWPGVLVGQFGHEDAVAIFSRYFLDENPVIREAEPDATLLVDEALAITW